MGLAAGAVGLWGDCLDWWGDHAFLGNLLTSITSLLIGVPFALLFVSRLNDDRNDAVARRAAKRRAYVVVTEFTTKTRAHFKASTDTDRQSDLEEVKSRMSPLLTQLRPASRPEPDVDAWRQTAQMLRQLVADMKGGLSAAFGSDVGKTRKWVVLVAQMWLDIDRDLRPQLEGFGFWIPAEVSIELRGAATRLAALDLKKMQTLSIQWQHAFRVYNEEDWARDQAAALADAETVDTVWRTCW
ncbi:hypothetical protein [Streptomyces sp. NPDC057287]|uniref:hypothetical protein n=1 Tax=Streptomyces sp. NPDC057287 TaxID=3346086 RepID=UPI00363D60B0